MFEIFLKRFKRVRRKILIPIFSIIKRSLNLFIQYIFPDYQKPPSIYQKYVEEQINNCYENFKEHFKTSLFLETQILREHSIKKAIRNDENLKKTYIEFGVFSGSSINFFSKFLKQKEIYGFDSFEGLKEDWIGTSVIKGTFDLNKKIPKLEKIVIPIQGWIEQTLPNFLEEKRPQINFMHIDVDTYETSKLILNLTKSFLEKGSIIVFDELYNFPGWQMGEYKALIEVFKKDQFKFISFAKNGQQAVIEIL